MKCINCDEEIPEIRLQAIPGVDTCVSCADKFLSARKGYMCYDHKTAPELILIDESDEESIRRADRANRRSR